MIDRHVFAREMAILSERFAREITTPVATRYYEILSAHLTTEQFERAAMLVFAEETFFPSPMVFVEKIRGSVRGAAEREWLALMESLSKNTPYELSESGRRALTAIGGTWALKNSANTAAMRASFLASYEVAEQERRQAVLALPAGER